MPLASAIHNAQLRRIRRLVDKIPGGYALHSTPAQLVDTLGAHHLTIGERVVSDVDLDARRRLNVGGISSTGTP